MKTFGIYIAYAPAVDLRSEGLGRHLAEFLKGAQQRDDIKFIIACPSWSRSSLISLFLAAGINADDFEIISPSGKPLLLRLHERYVKFKKRRKRLHRFVGLVKRIKAFGAKITADAERRLVSARSVPWGIVLGLVMLPVMIVSLTLPSIVITILLLLRLTNRRLRSVVDRYSAIKRYGARAHSLANRPRQDSSLVNQLYRLMEDAEASLMRNLIHARKDVAAWYSPTCFWPHFNEISAPRLMCVPDVVLSDFPIGFSQIGGNRFLGVFKRVQQTILAGEYYVTYSQDVKYRTLVKNYNIEPSAITVIPHGANSLDELIFVTGFADNDSATNILCRDLFRQSLSKAVGYKYATIFGDADISFIFYASQARPNKNIISLIRAYEYLLKQRYIGQKLILTGKPNEMPEIADYIKEHNLQADVLFLRRLTAQELAACYYLADLAVNPSLSEGGCPFTFTEALSVGTPAVMARIPVTEEVITAPDLQQLMLFDPYDWKDMANRIEWGLQNQQLLLEKQKPLYDELAKRTWRNVVDEYVEILDRISAPLPSQST